LLWIETTESGNMHASCTRGLSKPKEFDPHINDVYTKDIMFKGETVNVQV